MPNSCLERINYVSEYYERNYAGGKIDDEILIVGKFLINNVYGKVLDCGCGPVPQLWATFMPNMTELHAIDLPFESISFVNDKLRSVKWQSEFFSYVKCVKDEIGNLPPYYLKKQVKKIISVQQADMCEKLPFKNHYFDTIISLYSLGVLQNRRELHKAIINIAHKLKSGGILLHINTDGKNVNTVLPEYTWQGLEQTSHEIEALLKKYGFDQISIISKKIKNANDKSNMYKYNRITLLKAVKK